MRVLVCVQLKSQKSEDIRVVILIEWLKMIIFLITFSRTIRA